MLTDLLGYYRRNLSKMNNYQMKRTIKEMKEVVRIMENKMGRGVA